MCVCAHVCFLNGQNSQIFIDTLLLNKETITKDALKKQNDIEEVKDITLVYKRIKNYCKLRGSNK